MTVYPRGMATTRRPFRYRAAGGHAPPARAARARAAFLAVFAGILASIKGGDLNVPRPWVRRLLAPGRIVGHGVVWLWVSPVWRVLEWRLVDVGSDHLAVVARIRRRVGRHRGEELTVVVVNCRGVAGADVAARVLRAAIKLGADLVIGVECRPIRAVEVDVTRYYRSTQPRRPAAYEWAQPGRLDSPESGTVIGVRKDYGDLDRVRRRVGSPATREGIGHPSSNGRGIDERSIVVTRVTSRAS